MYAGDVMSSGVKRSVSQLCELSAQGELSCADVEVLRVGSPEVSYESIVSSKEF
jgi:hypothetical protein